ncbi:MAG TPA: hypothetical protein VGS41_04385, partial [Chthonomonadales bacterium]|nr:hypothetical protein [Chthonomonadales bacterium]
FQDPAGNCSPWSGVCPAGSAVDSSGNCTTDERNPYVLYLPQQQQSSPVVSAPTSATPSAGQSFCASGEYDTSGNCIAAAPTVAATPAASWFTDPTQELITGVPNWGLVAGAGLALMLLMRGRR